MSVKCLCKIGVLITNKEKEVDESSVTLSHNGKLYQPIIPWHSNYIEDVSKHSDFCIVAMKFDDGIEYLTIFHDGTRQSGKHRDSRRKIIAVCFPDFQSESMITVGEDVTMQNMSSDIIHEVTGKLYGLLRTAHLQEESKDILDEQAPNLHRLQPKLRNYQKKSVQWLLDRELKPDTLTSFYKKLPSSEGCECFVNIISLDIKDVPQENIVIPSGGILAEEMGLGKTVEMISLILLNPRALNPPDVPVKVEISVEGEPPAKKQRKNAMEIQTIKLLCVCLSTRKKGIIMCSKCSHYQHRGCVHSYIVFALFDGDNYICPKCWEHSGTQITSAATIIVSPSAIKLQWLSEINKHTQPPLRVLLYEGVSKQTISPKELASYDVVLTDYTTLRSEIYFMASNEMQMSLRTERRKMRVNSPLVLVNWWRVCLDEAQMESSQSQASKIVKQLPAIHRWAVTGTPVEQSLDDLLSLLEFIGFNEATAMWQCLSEQFRRNQTENIVKILQKVMWRTSKAQVFDELGIPPQTEFIHFVELNDVEKLFYSDEHADCLSAFYHKIKGRSDLRGVTGKDLNTILQPMLQLRQDCSIPVLCLKTDANVVKRFLQPQELLDHMKSTNELECKDRLRSMASIYNGMAALHFLKKDYTQSINYYEKVLALSKQYTGKISVDSLLQIHALYNVVQAYRTSHTQDNQIITEHDSHCKRLELKYLEPYALKLQAAFKGYEIAAEELAEKMPSKPSKVWETILQAFVDAKLDEQLVNKINDEVFLLHSSTVYERFRSLNSVLFVLEIWYKKLKNIRKELTKDFNEFDVLVQNVCKEDLSPPQKRLMTGFIRSVYDCHLSDFRKVSLKQQKTTAKESNEEKKLCALCEAEKRLQTYECLVFDKTVDEKTNNAEGTWNPTMQETVLKAIHAAVRNNRKLKDFSEDCELQLEAVSLMKTEYKELIKLWIEIEYTVKAFDELDMCKMRLSIANPEDEKTNYSVYEYEIDGVLEESRINFDVEQKEFVLKHARLKYIQHLEGNTDPGPCPICRVEAKSKFVVLECGHHLCFFCLKTIAQLNSRSTGLNCSICRNNQKFGNVYYVTRKIANSDEIEVKGDFSSKIQKIVIEVLKLQEENKDVKIIIFSQWVPILKAIGVALNENNINFKLATTPQCVEKFKDAKLGITCLLMFLKKRAQGLNLVEATHVFLVEPTLNTGEHLQAIGRVHRIGQTKPTFVHRFIVKDTIEENIHNALSKDKTKTSIPLTLKNIKSLFETNAYNV